MNVYDPDISLYTLNTLTITQIRCHLCTLKHTPLHSSSHSHTSVTTLFSGSCSPEGMLSLALAVKPIAILSQHLKVAWHVSDFLMTQVTLSNVGGGRDVKNNFLSNNKHLLSLFSVRKTT